MDASERPRLWLALALVVTALSIAACSDDDDEGGTTTGVGEAERPLAGTRLGRAAKRAASQS